MGGGRRGSHFVTFSETVCIQVFTCFLLVLRLCPRILQQQGESHGNEWDEGQEKSWAESFCEMTGRMTGGSSREVLTTCQWER